MTISRNEFLKTLGVTATATLTSVAGFASQPTSTPSTKLEATLKLGLASYTLRKFNLDEVIKISQRVGLSSVALKSMHMPLESSAEDIKAMADKIKSAGLHLYGGGDGVAW